MFTPQEVQEKKFPKAVFGGYDMSEVDNFLDKVSTDYADLYKDNALLKNKMKVLAEKVEEYRSVDASMRKALIVAQQMANEMTDDAKLKSDALLKQAQIDFENKAYALQEAITGEELRLAAAKEQNRRYIEESIEIYTQQIEGLRKIATEPIIIQKKQISRVDQTASEIERSLNIVIEGEIGIAIPEEQALYPEQSQSNEEVEDQPDEDSDDIEDTKDLNNGEIEN